MSGTDGLLAPVHWLIHTKRPREESAKEKALEPNWRTQMDFASSQTMAIDKVEELLLSYSKVMEGKNIVARISTHYMGEGATIQGEVVVEFLQDGNIEDVLELHFWEKGKSCVDADFVEWFKINIPDALNQF